MFVDSQSGANFVSGNFPVHFLSRATFLSDFWLVPSPLKIVELEASTMKHLVDIILCGYSGVSRRAEASLNTYDPELDMKVEN